MKNAYCNIFNHECLPACPGPVDGEEEVVDADEDGVPVRHHAAPGGRQPPWQGREHWSRMWRIFGGREKIKTTSNRSFPSLR